MATNIYTDATLFLDGIMISEATSVKIDHTNGAQVVKTMRKGLAGMSPGAKMSTWQVSTGAPRAGIDYDYKGKMDSLSVVSVLLFARGKKIKTTGFVTKVGEDYGTEKPADVTFELTCEATEESTL